MARVLTIGDIHLPATRPKYLEFCKDMKKKHRCNQIVFIGDVVDWHAISTWVKEPNCPGPKDEYDITKKGVMEWYKAFPKAKICIGNHDERPYRLAKTVNIPEFVLRDYDFLWHTPNWDWQFSFEIDDVHYRHGNGCSGVHPAWNLMNKIKCSVVIGHCHTRAGVKWSVNKFRRFFAMDTGCGISEKAWQFAYGKDTVERPICGCGVVIDGVPYYEIMPIGKGEKYYVED